MRTLQKNLYTRYNNMLACCLSDISIIYIVYIYKIDRFWIGAQHKVMGNEIRCSCYFWRATVKFWCIETLFRHNKTDHDLTFRIGTIFTGSAVSAQNEKNLEKIWELNSRILVIKWKLKLGTLISSFFTMYQLCE